MPGSTTTPDRRALAKPCLPCFAFCSVNGVGVRNKYLSRLTGWSMRTPADASDLPSRTSTHGSGSDVVRYAFIAMDFHLLLSAGLPGASLRSSGYGGDVVTEAANRFASGESD